VRATRGQVLALRARATQLGRAVGTLEDTAVLDVGVQDTGADGAAWALAQRGLDTTALADDALVTVWALRGAPHVYRRADLPTVAAALLPWSEADAAKRIFDAAKPLKAAGIPVTEAMEVVAGAMRELVTAPMVKGEMSGRLAERLPAPYLRSCVPCGAVHLYEQPFRLGALRAGLELQPGTSPPVLVPVPGLAPDPRPAPRHDLVRGYLRLLGPATPKQVAAWADAPVRDVTARWPSDAVEVEVEGERRWLLADDVALLDAGPVEGVHLLGAYDPLLQARDRDLLVPDRARAKELWPVLGRPGAVLVDGEVAGTWRAQQRRGLTVTATVWASPRRRVRDGVHEQAGLLAASRGLRLGGVELQV